MANETITRRPKAKIMVKLYRDSKAFSCNEFNFDRTLGNYYVRHHLDELYGEVDCPDDIFYRHHGNQPLIFFTLGFTNDVLGWNGLLHFSAPFSESVREFVQKRASVIDVVVAYHDPFTDRYHFIVDTHTEDLSLDNFRLKRKQVVKGLNKHISGLTGHLYNFYVRALPTDCYDILNRDALFNH